MVLSGLDENLNYFKNDKKKNMLIFLFFLYLFYPYLLVDGLRRFCNTNYHRWGLHCLHLGRLHCLIVALELQLSQLAALLLTILLIFQLLFWLISQLFLLFFLLAWSALLLLAFFSTSKASSISWHFDPCFLAFV